MKKSLVVLTLFMITVHCKAQTPEQLRNIDFRITRMLDSVNTLYHIPGFAMTVIKDTNTVYEKVYGVKRVDAASLITNHTQFYWASVTKVFTGAAIMQLYQQGKLDLNDPVIKYYPEFRTKKGKYFSDSVTIRHLLTHSSGLVKFATGKGIHNKVYDLPAEELLKNLKRKKLQFKPGTDYFYSNVGIEILGVIIERISGLPYEEYMQRNIFDPLHMPDATMDFSNNLTDTSIAAPHIRQGHYFKPSRRIYRRAMNAAGGMRASIDDMSTWMKACMQMGFHDQDRILTAEVFGNMWRDTLWCKPDMPSGYIAGYTWDCRTYKGEQFYAKGGNLAGESSSYIILFEESHLGMAFVTNFRFKGEQWDLFILKMIDIVREELKQ